MPKSNPELAAAMGKRIAERRRELGLTQEKVAERVGIAYQQYNKVEHGKSCLGSYPLLRVSEVLNISADYLLTGVSAEMRYRDVLTLLSQMSDWQLRIVAQVLQYIMLYNGENPQRL